MVRKKRTLVSSLDATRILQDAGFQVNEFSRYVDRRGMIRFVNRKTGLFGVEHHGWRAVSRGEAEQIQRANAQLKRNYLKPKMKKYF